MSRTFVLVPGAWHGGWAYQAVAAELRAAGQRMDHDPTAAAAARTAAAALLDAALGTP